SFRRSGTALLCPGRGPYTFCDPPTAPPTVSPTVPRRKPSGPSAPRRAPQRCSPVEDDVVPLPAAACGDGCHSDAHRIRFRMFRKSNVASEEHDDPLSRARRPPVRRPAGAPGADHRGAPILRLARLYAWPPPHLTRLL